LWCVREAQNPLVLSERGLRRLGPACCGFRRLFGLRPDRHRRSPPPQAAVCYPAEKDLGVLVDSR